MALAICKVDRNEKWMKLSLIPGFEQYDYYRISSYGNMCESYTWSDVKQTKHRSSGYKVVTIYGGRKSTTYYVHQLVALAFVDNPSNYEQVMHCNGIKTDNKCENLRWVPATD